VESDELKTRIDNIYQNLKLIQALIFLIIIIMID